jgi:hypothetical protein
METLARYLRTPGAWLPHSVAGVRDTIESIALLIIRGVLLWVVMPLVAVVWVLSAPVRLVTRHPLPLRCFLGWLDLNLIAVLERTILRPIAENPQSFVPWSLARTTEHRVGFTDLV